MMQEKRKHTTSKAEFCSTDGFRQEYELGKLHISIGAQAEADIAFPTLMFEHAELTHEQGEWVIRKRHPEATIQFRGYPIDLKKLNPGDKLFLGCGTLTFIGSSDQEITAITAFEQLALPYEQFELAVMNGPEKGRVISLEPGEYLLGRSEQKHTYTPNNRRVEFDHPFVSRTHARLFVDHTRLRIQDMMSTNGTRINRQLIKTGELKAGDKLFLGKLKLKVTGPDRSAHSPAPTVRVSLRDTTWRKYGLWIILFYAIIFFLAAYLVDRFLL